MIKYRKVFIIPYFGNLPELLKIWMYTCANNNDYDFFIYTDANLPTIHPQNVFFFKSSLKEINEKISSIVGFDVVLNSPYKLCDYRPAYGEIFHDDIEKYDFWGYCDLDILFGSISNFITDDVFDNYSKILTLGHFTLYKNTQYINSLYRLGDIQYFYKNVFSSNNNFFYDEGKYDQLIEKYKKKNLFPVWLYDDRYNINSIFSNNNIPIYVNFDIIADININKNNLQLVWGSCIDYKDRNSKKSVFVWENGILVRNYLKNNQIHKEEFMYIHLQKRKLQINVESPKNSFIVLSNSIEELPSNINVSFLKRSNREFFAFKYFILKVKTFIFHNGHRCKVILNKKYKL